MEVCEQGAQENPNPLRHPTFLWRYLDGTNLRFLLVKRLIHGFAPEHLFIP